MGTLACAYIGPCTSPVKLVRLLHGGHVIKVFSGSESASHENVSIRHSQFYITAPGIIQPVSLNDSLQVTPGFFRIDTSSDSDIYIISNFHWFRVEVPFVAGNNGRI